MARPALRLAVVTALACLTCSYPAAAAEPVHRADQFVDSIGVNVHMTYVDTAYRDRARLIDTLSRSGIRHVRDGLVHDTQYAYDSFNALAARGIKTTFIMGDPTERTGTQDQLLNALRTKVRGAAEAVEGPNEYAASGRRNWAGELRAYQQRLYSQIKGRDDLKALPVLAPSLVTWQDHAAVGDLSASSDYGNKHPYPGGDLPEMNVAEELAIAQRVAGPVRTYVTESGYNNAVNMGEGHKPASEGAAASYLPRMYLEYFRRGIPRTFGYELIDPWADPARRNQESNFGLLRNDFSEKPAFRSLTNLIALLNDRGATVTPRALGHRIEDAPADLRQLVLQKSDGTHYLVLWRAVRNWDPQTRRTVEPGTSRVRVRLAAPGGRVSVYSPVRSRTAIARPRGSDIGVALGADPVVLAIPAASGAGITVPRSQTLRSVLRRGLVVRCHSRQRSRCRVRAHRSKRLIGAAQLAVGSRARSAVTLRLRPTRSGRRVLARALLRRPVRGMTLTLRSSVAGQRLTRTVRLPR